MDQFCLEFLSLTQAKPISFGSFKKVKYLDPIRSEETKVVISDRNSEIDAKNLVKGLKVRICIELDFTLSSSLEGYKTCSHSSLFMLPLIDELLKKYSHLLKHALQT